MPPETFPYMVREYGFDIFGTIYFFSWQELAVLGVFLACETILLGIILLKK